MSDAATSSPVRDEKQYVVLVIGSPDEENYGKLMHSMQFTAKVIGGSMTALHVDVDRYLSVDCNGAKKELQQYLREFSQVLSSSAVVRMVYSNDQRSPVEAAFKAVFGAGVAYETYCNKADEGNPDQRPIEELQFGVRTFNCLKRSGVNTVADLLCYTEAELAAIPNLGKRCIDEVVDTLKASGVALRA